MATGPVLSGSAIGYLVDGLVLGGLTTGSAEEFRHLNIKGQSGGAAASVNDAAVARGEALSSSFNAASGSIIQALNCAAALAVNNQVTAGDGIAVTGDAVSLDLDNNLSQVTLAAADKLGVYDVTADSQGMSTITKLSEFLGGGTTPGLKDTSGQLFLDIDAAGTHTMGALGTQTVALGDGSNTSGKIVLGQFLAGLLDTNSGIVQDGSNGKLEQSDNNLSAIGAALATADVLGVGDASATFAQKKATVGAIKVFIEEGFTMTGNSTFAGTTIANLGTVTTATSITTDALVATTADINGGTIDGVTIATSDITVGTGKELDVSGGTLETSQAQKLAIVQGVGANTDIGSFDFRAQTLTADGLTATRVVFAGADGVLSDDSDMTFSGDTLTVTKLGAYEQAGAVNFASSAMTNVDINSGAIDGAIIGANSAAAGTFTALDCSDNAFAIANLDINGGTDIGEALVDADLIVVDNGADDVVRKSAVSRLNTYLAGKVRSQSGAVTFAKNKMLVTGTDQDGASQSYRINVEGGLLRLTTSDLS